jgi:hypothetical protein
LAGASSPQTGKIGEECDVKVKDERAERKNIQFSRYGVAAVILMEQTPKSYILIRVIKIQTLAGKNRCHKMYGRKEMSKSENRYQFQPQTTDLSAVTSDL